MQSNSTIRKFSVQLQGMAPGLIWQKKIDDQGDKVGVHLAHDKEAELHAHWVGEGKKRSLAIPWVAVYRSICSAASDFKYRGRKTMVTLVAATLACETDFIPIGTDKYEVYVENVRIPPKTGAMVQVGRPRVRDWTATFVLIVDSEMYGETCGENLQQIITHAGKLIGILAWRPQLKGPYGRFKVTKFEEIK